MHLVYGDGIHLTIAHKREWSHGFKSDNKRLCPSYVLHGAPQRLMQTIGYIPLPSIALQHPAPTQIIPQVMHRYPVEPAHPLFQPLVVPVYMLDVRRTHDPFPLSVVHHLMRYSLPPTETCIHPRAIATEHRIRRNKRLEHSLDSLSIQSLQLKIRQMTRSVLHHHHRDVIRPGSSGSPLTSSPTGRTG